MNSAQMNSAQMNRDISESVSEGEPETDVVVNVPETHHREPASNFRRFRIPITTIVLFLAYIAVYPRRIELSGDQTAAVVAAESMLREGVYKVSLHESYGPEFIVNVGADLRQPLRWYPPGYTLALYGFARIGLSLAGAALLVFYLAKLVWTLTWISAGLAYNIPYWMVASSVAFALLLTYPSTTTEIFESTAIALLFVALSNRLAAASSACLASSSLAAGTLFRFAAVKLLGFYALSEWIRRPRISTCVKVGLTAIPSLFVYYVCTRVIGGESTPYHGVGPALHTNWLLLPKGFYYAATGGWSPTNLPLRVLVLVVLSLAFVGLVRRQTGHSLPSWIVLLIGLQAYYMMFLIVTQILFGSMYADIQPAFATPRFFALTQPLNVSAILFLVPFSCMPLYGILRNASAALIFICMVDWTAQNHRIVSGMVQGPDGFFRFADVAAVHGSLHSANPDGIFDGTGVFVYTAANPRIIYPDNIAGLRSPTPTRIAVVRFAGVRDSLVNSLEKEIAPYHVDRFNRFEVDFFALPSGFDLRMKPGAGFVPHI